MKHIYRKSSPPPGYYVYAYLRKSDSTPYYIGKGQESRAWGKHHFRIPKDKSKIVIVESNLTEIGSLALERRLIKWYGRKDLGTGILNNKTDGGDGSQNIAPATRAKISKKLSARVPWNKGIQTGPRSPESVAKQSASTKGISKSRDVVERMKGRVPWNKGKKTVELLSLEARAKISSTHKGKSKTAEHNLKNSLAQKEYHRKRKLRTM